MHVNSLPLSVVKADRLNQFKNNTDGSVGLCRFCRFSCFFFFLLFVIYKLNY